MHRKKSTKDKVAKIFGKAIEKALEDQPTKHKNQGQQHNINKENKEQGETALVVQNKVNDNLQIQIQ